MDLKNKQLKEAFGNLVTIGTTAGTPTTGILENGNGDDITTLNIQNGTARGLSFGTDTSGTGSRAFIVLDADGSDGIGGGSDYSFLVQDGTTVTDLTIPDTSVFSLKDFSGTRLTVLADGKVGIGTDTPDQLLHLKGTSPFMSISHTSDNSTSGILFRRTDNNQNRGTILYDFASDAMTFRTSTDGTGESIRIDSSGNLGIGESSVDAKLHLTTEAAGLVNQKFESAGGAAWRLGVPASQTYFAFDNANDALSSPKLVIDTNGKVGIGTASPSSTLHLESASSPKLIIKDTTNNCQYITYAQNSNAHLGTSSSHPLIIDTNNTERLRVLSGGGVTFNGDTATANALDDYEEGTFTPSYIAASTDFTSVTYDTGFTGGKYTKIGDLVHIQGAIRTDAITVGSASGDIKIAGLPFAIGSSTNGRDGFIAGSIGVATDFAGDHPVTHYGGAGTSNLIPMTRNSANGATATLGVSDLATGADSNLIYFSATYKS